MESKEDQVIEGPKETVASPGFVFPASNYTFPVDTSNSNMNNATTGNTRRDSSKTESSAVSKSAGSDERPSQNITASPLPSRSPQRGSSPTNHKLAKLERAGSSSYNPSFPVANESVKPAPVPNFTRRHSLMAPILLNERYLLSATLAGSAIGSGRITPTGSNSRMGRSVEFSPVVIQENQNNINASGSTTVLKPILKKANSRNMTEEVPHSSGSTNLKLTNYSITGGNPNMGSAMVAKETNGSRIISTGIIQNDFNGQDSSGLGKLFNGANSGVSSAATSEPQNESIRDSNSGQFGNILSRLSSSKSKIKNDSKSPSLKEVISTTSSKDGVNVLAKRSKYSIQTSSLHDNSGTGTSIDATFDSYTTSSSTRLSVQHFYIGKEESNRILLSFRNEKLESNYLAWFTRRYHQSWLRTHIFLLCLIMIYGVYNISRGNAMSNAYAKMIRGNFRAPYLNISDSQIFDAIATSKSYEAVFMVSKESMNVNSSSLSDENAIILGSNICPYGFYCSAIYPIGTDVLFLILFQILPLLTAFIIGKYASFTAFNRLNQLTTTISCLIVILFGVLLKDQVIFTGQNFSTTLLRPQISPVNAAIISNLFVLAVIVFARVRFIYAIGINIFWLGAYIPVFAYWSGLLFPSEINIGTTYEGRITSDYSIVSILAILMGSFISLVMAYDGERISRSLFVHEHGVRSKGKKLGDQLQGLKKTINQNGQQLPLHNTDVAHGMDLESPLEKSLTILRLLASDQSLSQKQQDQLNSVIITLVTRANNLLSPDWNANTAINGKDPLAVMAVVGESSSNGKTMGMDDEQEAWMVNEFISRSNMNNQSYYNILTAKSPQGRRRSYGTNNSSSNKDNIGKSIKEVEGEDKFIGKAKLRGLSDFGEKPFEINDGEADPLTHDSNNTSLPALSMSSLGALSVLQKTSSFQKKVLSTAAIQETIKDEDKIEVDASIHAKEDPQILPNLLQGILDNFLNGQDVEKMSKKYGTNLDQSVAIMWYDKMIEYFERTRNKSDSALWSTDIRSKLMDYNADLFIQLKSDTSHSNAHKSKREIFATCLKDLEWQSFNVFNLSISTYNHPLTFLSIHLFQKYNLFGWFKIPMASFLPAVLLIEKGYRTSSTYHNSIHAADVLHAVSCFVDLIWWNKDRQHLVSTISNLSISVELLNNNSANSSSALQALMLDVFALLLASMVHDYDHPGVNNNFLITTKSPWAILYNDRHVLENHHVSSAFNDVLYKERTNFLSCLGSGQYKILRASVIEMVLATDLAQHFEIVNFFKGKIAAAGTVASSRTGLHPSDADESSFVPERKREDQMLLLKILLKSADVSNASKPFALYGTWVLRILQEFVNQGENEKSLGIPISPFMDRETIQVASSQRGFIDVVCKPLLENLVTFLLIQTTDSLDDAENNGPAPHRDSDGSGGSGNEAISNMRSGSGDRVDALETSCARAMILNLQKNRKVWDIVQGLPRFIKWDGNYGIQSDLDIDIMTPPPMPALDTIGSRSFDNKGRIVSKEL